MSFRLLPASAAPFAPRSPARVILGSTVEPWLTKALKQAISDKRPLNSAFQHQKYLEEILSSKNAIWTLSSILVAKFPDLPSSGNHELHSCYEMLRVEAYIIYVDTVWRNEVVYKLTDNTIQALIRYHKTVRCPIIASNTSTWSGKDKWLIHIHESFIQTINKFFYGADVSVLEGLEEGGIGELSCDHSEGIKVAISRMMTPLLPPQAHVKIAQTISSDYEEPQCPAQSPPMGDCGYSLQIAIAESSLETVFGSGYHAPRCDYLDMPREIQYLGTPINSS